jgi:membrane protein DedA with SNARE-associated domain
MLSSFAAYASIASDFTSWILDFVRLYPNWMALIVLLLAFGESLAFVSLIFPFWGVMVLGIGPILGATDALNFWTVVAAAGIGAALGDWLSYWVGRKLERTVQHVWPLSRHPDLIPKGEAFIKKWGALGIFIGRFSGPLRASVPLVAGIFEMPFWRFQAANWVSAFVWAGVLLTIGDVTAKTFRMIFG